MKIRRRILFTQKREDILLEYLPFFKIKNCPQGFPRPDAEIGHHPIFMEYSFESRSHVEGLLQSSYDLSKKPRFSDYKKDLIPDVLVDRHDSLEAQDEVVSLVNAITPYYIFQYDIQQAWFMPLDGESKSHWGQVGYHQSYEPNSDSIEGSKNYDLHDPIALIPVDEEGNKTRIKLSSLFRRYYDSTDKKKKRDFLSACSVLSRAQKVSTVDISAAFLLLIGSLEALVGIIHKNTPVERCSECGQERY